MPQLHNLDDNYEPSRPLKTAWLTTRKTPAVLGGFTLPGLFNNSGFGGDLLGWVIAILLEIYGLYNLWLVGRIAIAAALSLVVLDLIGAILFHFRQAHRTVLLSLIALAPSVTEGKRLRLKDTFLHKTVRGIGASLIGASAVWKMVSFCSIASLTKTPQAIMALVCFSYLVTGLLHIKCTGWAFAEASVSMRMWVQRRKTLRDDPATTPCGIHGARESIFPSPVKLVETSVESHTLAALGGGSRYVLRTRGLLLDEHVTTLAAMQPEADQKTVVAREALRAQIAMLDQQPLRPIANLKPLPAHSEATASSGLCAVMSAVVGIAAVFFVSGCAEPPHAVDTAEVHVVIAGSELSVEKALPASLIDLLAPAPKPGEEAPILVPRVSVELIGAQAPQAIESKANDDVGYVAGKVYRVEAPAEMHLASTRDQLEKMRFPETAEQPATVGDCEAHLINADGKPRGFILAVSPGTTPEGIIHQVGSAEVTVFNDNAAARAAIAEKVKAGTKEFTILLSAKSLAAAFPSEPEPGSTPPENAPEPTAGKSGAEAAGESHPPEPVGTRGEPESVPVATVVSGPAPVPQVISAPEVLTLDANFSLADLIDGAEEVFIATFAPGNAKLDFRQTKAVEQLAASRRTSLASRRLIVVGYCDSTGKQNENRPLSLNRAKRLADELQARGLKVAAIVGAGETCPIAADDTTQGRAQNRRAIAYWK